MAHVEDPRVVRREAARRAYGPLFARATSILHAHDPVGVARAGAPADEYEPEVATILPRLITARGQADVRHIVHEELVRWFSPAIAGDEGRCAPLADELWNVFQGHLREHPAEVARSAWATGGFDHEVGRVLHDALAVLDRPRWAGGVLATACRRMVAPAAVTRVVDLADDRPRWSAARGALREVRELGVAAQRPHAATRRERGLLGLAEVVAQIVSESSGTVAALEPDPGGRFAARLRALVLAAVDPAFTADAERALFAIAGPAVR